MIYFGEAGAVAAGCGWNSFTAFKADLYTPHANGTPTMIQASAMSAGDEPFASVIFFSSSLNAPPPQQAEALACLSPKISRSPA